MFLSISNFQIPVPKTFNRSQMGVRFSHYISILNYGISMPFSNSEYISLLHKIHSKFDLILYNWEESELLPLSAARYNKLFWNVNATLQKSTSKSPIQIWLHVGHYSDSEAEGHAFKPEALEQVLKQADYANSIFSKTVPVISLQDQYIESVAASWTYYNMLQASKVFKNSTKRKYKVAVRYEISQCSEKAELLANDFFNKFNNIFIFYMIPQTFDYQIGVETFFHKVTSTFEDCKLHFVRSEMYSKLSIRIVFQTTWADSYDRSSEFAGIRENITSLVWFWKKMNDWAVNTTNFVIMYQAFDAASWDHRLDWQTNGMWRVVENASYNNAQEYVFEDKFDNLPNPMEIAAKNSTWLQKNSEFNQDKISVVLDPYISEFNGKEYNFETIPVMLKVIATRFNKVMIEATDEVKQQLPRIIAEYNKQNAGIRPFQVYLESVFAPKGIWSTQVSLRKTIAAVDDANSIFPNTVHMLILRGLLSRNQNISETRDQFKYIGNLTASRSVKLGRVFPTEICSDDEFDSFIKPVLVPKTLLDTIVLTEHMYNDMKNLGPKRHMARNFALAERCKTRIKNISESIDIVLKLGWSSESGKEYELVWYWEQISAWSTATNISVIMSQAMDTLGMFHGWWRLIGKAELKNPQDYKFEDKKESKLIYYLIHLQI